MYKIAIVEDELSYAQTLTKYIEKYGKQNDISFICNHFKNGVHFLEEYDASYDLIFMDIQMPYINGMDTAQKLREIDSQVLLIFITNLSQYAIKGYSVNAFDYVLKPISYHDFAMKISHALRRISATKKEASIMIQATTKTVRVPVDKIRYIEIDGHHLIYHIGPPGNETTYRQYATMKSILDKMEGYDFSRCNNCYLVNLYYVQNISGYTVTVDGYELQISQPRKKEFVSDFKNYSEKKLK